MRKKTEKVRSRLLLDRLLIKQMWFVPHLQKNGGDAMKSFNNMLILLFTFGIFLMALLTFIFNFR